MSEKETRKILTFDSLIYKKQFRQLLLTRKTGTDALRPSLCSGLQHHASHSERSEESRKTGTNALRPFALLRVTTSRQSF
jgi:hypothetical protein